MSDLRATVFSSFPSLETERLRLRETGPGDAAATLAVLSSEDVCRYYDLSPLTLEAEAAALIAPVTEALKARGATIRDLRVTQASLEDVFIHLTGRGLR